MGIRQGLPHLYSTRTEKGNWTPSLSIEQFSALVRGGQVFLDTITEKTDGATFLIGYDKEGFFTQHSGSGVMRARVGSDHIMRAIQRAQERRIEYNETMPMAMDSFHRCLHNNDEFLDYLRHQYKNRGEVQLRGEAFIRSLGQYNITRNEIKFVHTYYSAKNIGSIGSFILHSQLDVNKIIKSLNHFSNEDIVFDSDHIPLPPTTVNVEEEISGLEQIDRVAHHEENFNKIKKMVCKKVTRTLSEIGIKNKWGTGTEGLVVHPSDRNPEAPRFKITSRKFQKAKVTTKRF